MPIFNKAYETWVTNLHFIWFLLWKAKLLPQSIEKSFNFMRSNWKAELSEEFQMTSAQDFTYNDVIVQMEQRHLIEAYSEEVVRLIDMWKAELDW